MKNCKKSVLLALIIATLGMMATQMLTAMPSNYGRWLHTSTNVAATECSAGSAVGSRIVTTIIDVYDNVTVRTITTRNCDGTIKKGVLVIENFLGLIGNSIGMNMMNNDIFVISSADLTADIYPGDKEPDSTAEPIISHYILGDSIEHQLEFVFDFDSVYTIELKNTSNNAHIGSILINTIYTQTFETDKGIAIETPHTDINAEFANTGWAGSPSGWWSSFFVGSDKPVEIQVVDLYTGDILSPRVPSHEQPNFLDFQYTAQIDTYNMGLDETSCRYGVVVYQDIPGYGWVVLKTYPFCTD